MRILLPGSDAVINSFIQILAKIPNLNKLDLRVYLSKCNNINYVFLVPSDDKVCTLANYLSVHDYLYETLVYRPCLANPYYKVFPKDQFDGDNFQEFLFNNVYEHDKESKECLYTKCR